MAVGRSLPTSSPPAQAGVERIPEEAPPLAATIPTRPRPSSSPIQSPAASGGMEVGACLDVDAFTEPFATPPRDSSTPWYKRRLADVALADDGDDRGGCRR
ncbi:hypothetical protein OsI_33712 [Oryza sativa Indica Group]|jgi:hypothetical protein|uniref:Uncharacterized protein n=1 Tax=Oryza sativa subsp. indica TaxID=39946 RepID=B8BH01_ORYSI|nr:hypothetical protein OsI_33712 [Oryza sativa Indica Group]